MKKRRLLRYMNMILAGCISAIGFQSCDKGDEPCMYGPAPDMYGPPVESYFDIENVDDEPATGIDLNVEKADETK